MTPRPLTAGPALAPVPLAEVRARAELLTRFDRKYVVQPAVLDEVVDRLAPTLGVLDIGGRTSFAYTSVYFDTPDRRCYRDAAHGRRRRYKVRTRTYLDTGECVLEVKARGGRDQTVKARLAIPPADHGRLTGEGRSFVADVVPFADPAALRPVLTTAYRRTTLVELDGTARVTYDDQLVCATPAGSVGLDTHVVVESKSTGPATAFDRALWARGIRPVALSKYCVGLAALEPGLPANKWHRVLRSHFSWPATLPAA